MTSATHQPIDTELAFFSFFSPVFPLKSLAIGIAVLVNAGMSPVDNSSRPL
jgi:hypothetical protein